MKLKARKTWNTIEVEVYGMTFVVRELSATDISRLARENTKQVADATQPTGVKQVTDWEAFRRAFLHHIVADVRGVTEPRLRAVADVEIGSEEELDMPDPGADGVFPYERDRIVFTVKDADGKQRSFTLIEYLWARGGERIRSLEAAAKNLSFVRLAAEEAQKKTSLIGSVAA